VKVLLEVNSTKHTVKVSARGIDPGRNFTTLIDNLDTLITDWLQVPATITVPCSHCIRESSYDPFLFPLSALELAASQGHETVLCRGTTQVRVSDLAPDVSMTGIDGKSYSR